LTRRIAFGHCYCYCCGGFCCCRRNNKNKNKNAANTHGESGERAGEMATEERRFQGIMAFIIIMPVVLLYGIVPLLFLLLPGLLNIVC